MGEARVYDPATGHLTGITSSSTAAGLIQNLSYNFDTLGNLLSRTDQVQLITESFVYDSLNRVTSSTVAPSGQNTGGTTVSVAYDALGNITSKSDIGAYTYGPGTTCTNTFAGPHAVSAVVGTKNANYCYDNVGNLTQGDGRTVAWTAFNMPSQIVQGLRTINITYGPDRARFKRVDVNETGTSTTYYVAGGGHEVVTSGTTVTHKTYIAGVAVVLETTSTPTSTQTIYLLKDHLGSTDVVTDSTGQIQTRYSFDAWGKRRDVNWAAFFPAVPTSLWQQALTTRGYTGHEELDEVGLVHMNGRVYDPELGRFLSADSFVQNPSDLQSLNRYSYVQNNPLSFTDPTGHFLSGLFKAMGHFFTNAWHAVTGAIQKVLKSSLVRAVIQIAVCAGAVAYAGPAAPGVCGAASGGLTWASGGTPGQAFLAFVQAFISTAVWMEVGEDLKFAPVAKQIFFHGVVQGALSLTQGGNFFQGFAIGAISEAATVGTRGQNVALRLGAVSAVGGFVSRLTGGKFANGAISAAFAFLYNEVNTAIKSANTFTIFIGGADDNRAGKPVYDYYEEYRDKTNSKYFPCFGDCVDGNIAAVKAFIKNDLSADTQITVIGHSWGAFIGAEVVMALPGRIDTLITIDGVDHRGMDPNFAKVQVSVKFWIAVNAAGGSWYNPSNVIAFVGTPWNAKPSNFTPYYLEYPMAHEDFSPMMKNGLCVTPYKVSGCN